MRFVITHDSGEFAERVGDFLSARIERHLLAIVLLDARRGRYDGAGPFAVGFDERGVVCAAALRTPPRQMLVTELDDGPAGELVEAWLADDPLLPGVAGPTATVRAIAAAWSRRTGGTTRCRMRQAMHALSEVTDPPRPATGRLRQATAGDRDLLVGWQNAFATDVGVGAFVDAARSIDARLARGGQFVWDDGGPVSMVGHAQPVAGVVRIGPVYTPPELRGRGYASSAVADVSRFALAGGAQRCALNTDLANPTSNRIYASIGYRAFCDWEEHELVLP